MRVICDAIDIRVAELAAHVHAPELTDRGPVARDDGGLPVDTDDQVSNFRRLIDQVARGDGRQVFFLGGDGPVEAGIEELLGPNPVERRDVPLLQRAVPGQFNLQDFVLGIGALSDGGDGQDNQQSGQRQNSLH
jgi:hypothetical protein